MEAEQVLIGLTSVIVFGIGAQWLGWKLKLPAILLLLISGFIAGPVLGIIHPEQLMGGLFTPFISLSVGIILFEGSLDLRFSELKNVGKVVVKLVSIGVLITWLLTAILGFYIFNLSWKISVLLGAILVVTGPTVIIPLLRQVRPTGQVSSILKWEGIVIDPIGALLSVLVFEGILATGFSEATHLTVISIMKTIVFGSLVGLAGAALLYTLLKRYLLPDFLLNPVTLMIVIAVFTISDMFQHESGLWATTLMGITLANQKTVRINHIAEFKENLRLLLLSALFILLAARFELSSLVNFLNWNMLIFLAFMIFIVRPVGVYFSSLFSPLSWQEKLFLSWMAPRGVVAASISSIFAISLAENGFEDANQLASIVFVTIITTVAIYGLSAPWVARKLGVAKPVPKGFLIIGAHQWAIDLANCIKEADVKIILADSNLKNIKNAHAHGLETFHGNILTEDTLDHLNLDGIGRLLSLTSNDEVNSLASIRFGQIFDRSNVFQLPPNVKTDSELRNNSTDPAGRILFGEHINFDKITSLFASGWIFQTTTFTQDFTFKEYKERYGDDVLPLFLIEKDENIYPFVLDNPLNPQPNDKVISLVDPSLISIQQKSEKVTEEQ